MKETQFQIPNGNLIEIARDRNLEQVVADPERERESSVSRDANKRASDREKERRRAGEGASERARIQKWRSNLRLKFDSGGKTVAQEGGGRGREGSGGLDGLIVVLSPRVPGAWRSDWTSERRDSQEIPP